MILEHQQRFVDNFRKLGEGQLHRTNVWKIFYGNTELIVYLRFLPTSAQVPAQLTWTELVLILLYPASTPRPAGQPE